MNGRPVLLAHSTEDSQIPFKSFMRLREKVDGENVSVFVREGDEHFICYDEHFEHPQGDVVFSEAVLEFLEKHF